ncbi:MAG: HlyD family efflux transporter periplasmic adaptor subunit [Pirellulaceae bacterium]
MSTLADSLVSSTSRPIALRMRPDLSARRHKYHGQSYWVVKEPIGLNYYRFHDEEYAILCMLDGYSSMESIKERFESEFVPQKINYTDLQQFIGMLHRSTLVISQASGQGYQLKTRRDQKRRREMLGRLSNVFAVRWRGIDPERILNRVSVYANWCFSWITVVCVCLFALSALTLVAVQFDKFVARLPTFHQFFGSHNWIYMFVTMAVVKVLHEFGHGLSCKRFGGECHEMGFMLLVFTPALYCNVSDSWMLPNKWHRVAIGAAGMYVEMFIASMSTFIWWFSEPGLLNQLALSMMFICSVSTLLFNGNPLLRFDGYYILMDIVEIPNLRQKSTEILKRFMTQVCLGIEQPENPFLPQGNRFIFGLYTVAAVIYRWVVVFSILMFLNMVLEPYGLKVIGRMIGCIGFFGLIVQPIWKLGKFFHTPGRMHQVKRHRVAATVGLVALVLAMVCWIPLPYHIKCAVRIVPREMAQVEPGDQVTVISRPVYASVPCRLAECLVEAGMQVEAKQLLARGVNHDLDLTVLKMTARLSESELQLQTLRLQRRVDPDAAGQIQQVQETIQSLQDQVQELQQNQARLEIRAPIAGTVLPPVHRKTPPGGGDGRLRSWDGSPLDPINVGAYLNANDMVCIVGDPDQLDAELIIDQEDIELVRPGQKVEIQLELYPGRSFQTTIQRLALVPMTESPVNLASQSGGQLGSQVDATGTIRPINTSYQAIAPIHDTKGLTQIDLRGQAKIKAGSRSLGSRLYRYVARTFHFYF